MTTAAPFSEKIAKLPQAAPVIALTPMWHVVVLNDPVNLMPYVVMVIQKIFGYELQKAKKHMLQIHEDGRSILWTGPREKAEHYVYQLQQWQLNALITSDA
jgi:ATP-dependent Clp protease adaptor protein ClpS